MSQVITCHVSHVTPFEGTFLETGISQQLLWQKELAALLTLMVTLENSLLNEHCKKKRTDTTVQYMWGYPLSFHHPGRDASMNTYSTCKVTHLNSILTNRWCEDPYSQCPFEEGTETKHPLFLLASKQRLTNIFTVITCSSSTHWCLFTLMNSLPQSCSSRFQQNGPKVKCTVWSTTPKLSIWEVDGCSSLVDCKQLDARSTGMWRYL